MAQVSVGDNHMESRDDVLECLNAFSDSMGLSIHAFNAHAGRFGKSDFVRVHKKDMYVIFWNNSLAKDITPSESAFFKTVLGVELQRNQRDGCQPGANRRGQDLLTDDDGNTYAEIETFEGKIFVYILFDLPHANESYDLLYRIMEQVAGRLGKEVAPRDMTDIAKKRLIQRYQTFLKAGITASTNQIEQQIRQCQQQRDQWRQRYAETYNQEREYALRLEALKNGGIKESDKIEKDIDKICSHKYVASMNVMRGIMTVDTKPLTYKDRAGYTRNLGAFRLTIHPEREPVVQRLGILANIPEGDRNPYANRLAHPHSTGTGHNMCWGNIGAGVVQLALDKEYFTLIDLVINFLLNINEDDPYGQRVQYWPTIGEPDRPAPVPEPPITRPVGVYTQRLRR